jgi:hypothetical protein
MTGASCATLTYTKCWMPVSTAAETAARRDQIHGAKFGSLRRVWVGGADQLHKSICGTHPLRIGLLLKRVAKDRCAAWRKLSRRALARECADRVAPP